MDIKEINNKFEEGCKILNQLFEEKNLENEKNKDSIIEKLKFEKLELIQQLNKLKEENNSLKKENLLLKNKNLKLINNLEDSEQKLQIIKNTIEQSTI